MILWWGVAGIIVFYILILGVGLFAARRTKRTAAEAAAAAGSNDTSINQEAMIIAGRNIPLLVGCFTMTATWVDGSFINGIAEVIATQGLVWLQPPFGYAISLLLGGLFYAGPMRAAGYVTMVDAFQRRYGERIGGLMFIPAALGETFWTAAILAALGSALSVILEIKFYLSVICSAVFATVYCGIGGAWAIAYTDCVQLTCLFFGLVSESWIFSSQIQFIFAAALSATPANFFQSFIPTLLPLRMNYSQWLTVPFALSNAAVDPIFKNFHRWSGTIATSDIGIYIDTGLLIIFGGIAWQSYFQRVLSARSVWNARILSMVGGVGCFIMAFPSLLLGAAASVTHWNMTAYGKPAIEDTVMTLPLTLRYLTPIPVAVIGMGAICAAVMSSTDASIFSAASMFTRNIYKMVFRPHASEREVIWILRFAVVLVAVLSTLLAIFTHSVYALWVLCSDLVYVILFPELTCVLFYRHANGYGAVCGFFVGLVLRLIGGEPLINLPPAIAYPMFEPSSTSNPRGRQLFPFKTLAMVCCYISIFLFSELTLWIFRRYPRLANKIDVLDVVEQLRVYDERKRILTGFASTGGEAALAPTGQELTAREARESFVNKKPRTDLDHDELRRRKSDHSVHQHKGDKSAFESQTTLSSATPGTPQQRRID